MDWVWDITFYWPTVISQHSTFHRRWYLLSMVLISWCNHSSCPSLKSSRLSAKTMNCLAIIVAVFLRMWTHVNNATGLNNILLTVWLVRSNSLWTRHDSSRNQSTKPQFLNCFYVYFFSIGTPVARYSPDRRAVSGSKA